MLRVLLLHSLVVSALGYVDPPHASRAPRASRAVVGRGSATLAPRPDADGFAPPSAPRAVAATPSREPGVGQFSLSCTIFKLIVGLGMFCLPSATAGLALAPALAMVAAAGLVGAYSFELIGRLTAEGGDASFDALWARRLGGGGGGGGGARGALAGPTLPLLVVLGLTAGSCAQFFLTLSELVAPTLDPLLARAGAGALGGGAVSGSSGDIGEAGASGAGSGAAATAGSSSP